MTREELRIESICVHAGTEGDPLGSVVPPIYQTSTFRFRDAQHGADLFMGEGDGYIYTRLGNPTIEAMEHALTELEGGYKALGCSSGMAAIHTAHAAFLRAGDHVICSEAVYGPVTTLFDEVFSRSGIDVTFVDSSDLEAVRTAVRPNTALFHIETPANPTLVVSDLAALAEIAHNAGAKMIVDNTFLTPILQKPLEFGADIVVHSLTKFLNGHADVVAGVIVPKKAEDYKTLRSTLNLVGGVIDPFNAFLVHRGLKTLALRMERHCENGQIVAEFLQEHPAIEWVMFPGLPSHPQYDLSNRQTSGHGSLMSFELRGGIDAGRQLMERVRLALLAVSLGGVETLIQHPASMTHAGMAKELREQAGITDGLVRLSVGIEHHEDIVRDLKTALDGLLS
jgi:methionine-gamma-lyase